MLSILGAISYKSIPFVGTGIFVLIISGLFIYLLRNSLKEKKKSLEFDKQLGYSINPQDEVEEKESFITKRLRHLPELFIKAEIVKPNVTVEQIQKKMLLVGAISVTIVTLITKNPVAGLIPLVFLYVGAMAFAMFKISKKKSLMNEQIPAFVSTFKANIQANQHAQNAMINAINNTASPLYDELSKAKSIMEAGDFRPGIVSLRMNTENDTLRQMASCIELASVSGSNIEEQIEIIEEIIQDKQKIERKKKLGVNENKPLFYVAAAFVPVSFFGSYFISDMHKDYWFTTPLSYAVVVGVIIAMLIASWATWKVIQKVDIG